MNGVGDGLASAVQSVQVFTTPAAPALGAIVAGDETLAVGFTAAGDGGSPITGYEYSTDGGATWRTRVSGTIASPLLITSESGAGASTLTNAMIYAVQLRAVNVAGSGAASETVLAAPRGTPSAPTAMTVAAGDGALVVTFTSSDDRRLADHGHRVSARRHRRVDRSWIAGEPAHRGRADQRPAVLDRRPRPQRRRAGCCVGESAGNTEDRARARPQAYWRPAVPARSPSPGPSRRSMEELPSPAYTVSLYLQATGGTAIGTCTTQGLLTCTASELTNGTTVYADVAAANDAGAGAPSSPRLALTPLAVPQVAIESITPGANDLSIAVDVIDDGGAPITAFEYQLGGGNWLSAHSATNPVHHLRSHHRSRVLGQHQGDHRGRHRRRFRRQCQRCRTPRRLPRRR